jgi:hypothetical protein
MQANTGSSTEISKMFARFSLSSTRKVKNKSKRERTTNFRRAS